MTGIGTGMGIFPKGQGTAGRVLVARGGTLNYLPAYIGLGTGKGPEFGKLCFRLQSSIPIIVNKRNSLARVLLTLAATLVVP